MLHALSTGVTDTSLRCSDVIHQPERDTHLSAEANRGREGGKRLVQRGTSRPSARLGSALDRNYAGGVRG
jgi:hypothetical protein